MRSATYSLSQLFLVESFTSSPSGVRSRPDHRCVSGKQSCPGEDVVLAISASPRTQTKTKTKTGRARLALEMTPEAISLHQEIDDGTWEEVGFAQPESDLFPRQIEALRVEALARMGRQAPVIIWLPEDQVLRRSASVRDTGPATRRNKAADLIVQETSYQRGEIEVAISPRRADGSADVLAILRQTRIEAESYARKWGFEPGAVTVRDPGSRFIELAQFAAADGTSQRVARAGLRWGTIATGLIGASTATAIGAWSLSLALKTNAAGPPVANTIVEIEANAASYDSAPTGALPIETRPETGTAQGLPIPATGIAGLDISVPYAPGWLTGFTPPARAATPVYLDADHRLSIGRALQVSDLPVLLASLDGTVMLRDERSEAPAKTENVDPVLAALGAVADAPLAAPLPFPKLAENGSDTTADVEEEPNDVVGFIAWTADLGIPQPVVRPGTAPDGLIVPYNGDDTATVDAAIAALPKPDEGTEQSGSVAASAAAPLSAPDTSSPGAPALEADDAVPDDTVTVLAVAPQPKPKPKSEATTLPSARALVPRSVRLDGPVSRSVSRAAKRQGLPLDRTSLIGIINVGSSREALLRLPNGRFRRIGQGDTLDGWKVSLIGRDAVRLQQGAKQHTLILVSR